MTRDIRLVTDQPPPGYAMMNLSCANAKGLLPALPIPLTCASSILATALRLQSVRSSENGTVGG